MGHQRQSILGVKPDRTERRLSQAMLSAVGAACVTVLLASGCKPPTFNELVGNTPEPQAPAQPPVIQAPAAPVQPPPAAPATPARPDPAKVIAEFRQKAVGQITDDDLKLLTSLDEGLDQLTTLKLMGAPVTGEGLNLVAKLPAVTDLDLSYLAVSPAAFADIKTMSTVEKLALQRVVLTDELLGHLSEMVNLKELNLDGTNLTDAQFVHLAPLVNLEVLSVNYTTVAGNGFEVFDKRGEKNTLREIHAHHTLFGNYGFVHIRGWKQLETLMVAESQVTDGSMQGLKGCAGLKKIDVSFNPITDLGVSQLVPLKKLEWISLRETRQPTDRGLLLLRGLKDLTFLDLEATSCTGAAVAALKKANKDLEIRFNGQKY